MSNETHTKLTMKRNYKPVTLLKQLACGKLHYGVQIGQKARWIQTATDGLPSHPFCSSRWVPHSLWDRCLPGLSLSPVYPSCRH